MVEVIQELMQKNQLTCDAINYIVPHQANERILNTVAQNLGIAPAKVMLNLDKLGNTTAATSVCGNMKIDCSPGINLS